jgi:2-dehydro-3-deoxygluconokinase
MKVNRIAIIGECMVELKKAGDLYQQAFGGDTLNTALYLSRLTHKHNITTSYVTGLGQDPFSHQMIDSWKNEGIDTSLVHISDSKLPGIYTITTTPEGERSFYYWRNDAAAKYWLRMYTRTDVLKQLSQYDAIYLSGISLAILPNDCRAILFDILAQCHQDGALIIFDNNYRSALWESPSCARKLYENILRLTDIAFLTFDDEQALYGDQNEQEAIQRTQNLGVKEIVIKRGDNDCFVVTSADFVKIPATFVANVLDTTAAGDSFSAAYLAKRFMGGNVSESAAAGHTLASTVIQHPGAIIPSHEMPKI